MASFTVLYTRPASDADAFVAEYRADHLPIAARFPGVQDISTTVFTATPRGGEPPYHLLFHATWESAEALEEAMRHPAMMDASRHAMGLVQKYGNRAEMLIGE